MAMDLAELEKIVLEVKARQDILQCVYRYSRGVDRLDRAMLVSAYHPDAIDDHGIFVGTAEEFADYFFAFHEKRQFSTHHVIGNHVCEVTGDTAHAETYYLYLSNNQYDPPVSMAAGRYIDRFECRGGRWAIAARKCVIEWDWDPGETVLPTEMIAAFAGVGQISRDRSDLSYDRPLMPDPARTGLKFPF
jgi:hypothetical protein